MGPTRLDGGRIACRCVAFARRLLALALGRLCLLCYVIGLGCVWERKGVRYEAGGEAAMIGTRRENGKKMLEAVLVAAEAGRVESSP